ncbi:MAG: 2-amino-4-hydroxy-6-hydroxymethyldihydropteridine diphosphokinase [Nitrospirae bacterium]|nr:MAG: 2-amino-4-hydroxy-6-hydroxymethyldihydropteridine diphosphokinase [Nitrospirota bacterium]
MATIFIGIGSNLGNREDNCRKAINLLKENGIAVKKQSSTYETEPWGVKEQPKFINMAIEAETNKKPEDLLGILKNIENQMGRTKSVKWGRRVIDLDILLYDDLIVETPHLEIPHPFMHEREFVLRPLAEIAPDKRHPVTGKTVREMAANLRQ